MEDKPFLVGITGGTGAGKTRLVKHLSSKIPSDKITIVNQDNYYHPRDQQPLDNKGIKNFDTLESLDLPRLAKDLQDLLDGKSFSQKVYNFNNPKLKEEYVEVKPAPLVIVEGLFALCHTPVFDLMDMSVFVDTTQENMLNRRINRDFVERGYDKQDVLYRFENHFLPAYRQYVLPLKQKADVTIRNDGHFEEAISDMENQILQKLSFLD